jgi:hypothetical protein
MIGSERDTYDIDKLIEHIQQDIQSAGRRNTRTENTSERNWLDGVTTGLKFALDHAKKLREND